MWSAKCDRPNVIGQMWTTGTFRQWKSPESSLRSTLASKRTFLVCADHVSLVLELCLETYLSVPTMYRWYSNCASKRTSLCRPCTPCARTVSRDVPLCADHVLLAFELCLETLELLRGKDSPDPLAATLTPAVCQKSTTDAASRVQFCGRMMRFYSTQLLHEFKTHQLT